MKNKFNEILIPDVKKFNHIEELNKQLHTINSEIPFSDVLITSWDNLKKDPNNTDYWIELGRNFKRQHLYREAIEAFSQGILNDSFNYLLFRHRAHTYLNIWRYEEAIADFALSIRLNPFHFDSWYLMGISYYLMRRFDEASKAFKQALKIADNRAEEVSTLYWNWFSLKLVNKNNEADKLLETIKPNIQLVSCDAFYKVLQLCKGLLEPEDILNIPDDKYNHSHVIMYYGLAQYYYLNNETDKGNQINNSILKNEKEKRWSGFAYQAAIIEKEIRGF